MSRSLQFCYLQIRQVLTSALSWCKSDANRLLNNCVLQWEWKEVWQIHCTWYCHGGVDNSGIWHFISFKRVWLFCLFYCHIRYTQTYIQGKTHDLFENNCLSKRKPKIRSVSNFQISTIEVKPTKSWPITTCAHSSS